jgi:uncharacterized membrane protein
MNHLPRRPLRSQYLAVVLVTLLGGVLRFYRLGSEPLWLDEAFTLRFARMSLYNLWFAYPLSEPNPPLYYTLQKFWFAFGQSEAAVRSLSAIIGTLNVPLVYVLGRILGGHWIGLTAAALLATSVVHIQFSQDARAYSLLIAAATLTLCGLARLLQDPAGASRPLGRAALGLLRGGFGNAQPNRAIVTDLAWFAYIVGACVALYSHNTALVLILLTQVIAFIWWARVDRFGKGFFWNWLAANAVILLIWSWWLRIVIYQTLITMADFPRATATLHRAAWTLVGVFGQGPVPLYGQPPILQGQVLVTPMQFWTTLFLWGFALLGLWSWRRKSINVALTATFVVGVPLLIFLIGLWRPVFMGRILLWPTVPLFVLIAAGLMLVRPVFLRTSIVLLAIVMQLYHTSNYYRDFVKEPWDQITAHIESRVRKNDVILFFPEVFYIPFQHYFRNFDVPQYYVPEASLAQNGALLKAISFDRIWFVVFARDSRDPTDLIRSELRRGAVELEYQRFHGAEQFEVFLFENTRSSRHRG